MEYKQSNGVNPLIGQSASAANVNVKDRERAAIDGALATLDDRLKNLARLVESVEIRFSPVLRPSPPATANGNTPTPSYGGSAIATIVGSQIEDAQRMTVRLEDMLSRCEL